MKSLSVLIISLLFGAALFVTAPVVYAEPAICSDGTPAPNSNTANCPGGRSDVDQGVREDNRQCSEKDVKVSVALQGNDKCIGDEGNPIIEYMRGAIKFLSGAFGLVVVLMIIISGVQYITSQGNPDQTKTAKTRLFNAVTGLVLFIMMYGILEYLIPGSIW